MAPDIVPSTSKRVGGFSLDRLETFGQVRKVDEESRQVTVVVSTGDVARDGAIIEQSGWSLANYERNPVVLWAHNDRDLPIAKTVRTITGDREMVQIHQFATHRKANEVFDLVREGFVNATSVRWIPGETEQRKLGTGKEARNVLVFTRGHELLETSYVPIPSDPGAMVVRADGLPLDMSAYEQADVLCAARGCENPSEGALCEECQALLDSARAGGVRVEEEARDQRVQSWAETLRAANKSLKGEAA